MVPRIRPRAPRSIATALLAAAVLVLGAGTSAQAVTRTDAAHSAATFAAAKGYKVGIAVIDTKTGQFYGAGAYNEIFASESLIKVFIATRLLVEGQMHGSTSARAYKMITQSDDAIASSLYGSVGGDGLINWIKARYHQPDLGTPPAWPGWWGSTHLRPSGLARLYVKLARDPKVAPWLLNAMHHATHYGSDGVYQYFGIPSATSGAAIKQGWGNDWDGGPNASFNSTGFVNNNRYAVVLMARGPASSYGSAISSLLTGVAKRLLPGGVFPSPQPTVSSLSTHIGPTAGGNRLTITGTNFTHVSAVRFGTHVGRAIKVLSPTRLQVTAPAYTRDWINVQVVTAYGASHSAPGNRYLFEAPARVRRVLPPLGPTTGGATISLRGNVFVNVRKVLFGSTPATFRVRSRWVLDVRVPAHAAGRVDIRVVTDFGTSLVTAADRYLYGAPPTVTSVSPATGPLAGGTSVTLVGAHFTPKSTVSIGGVPLHPTAVTADGSSLTVVTPAHTAGAVKLSVVTEYGTSPSRTFTYADQPTGP